MSLYGLAIERFLAQKTLFLLALATAKRIGERHALSYRVSQVRGWAEVSFSFVPGFVAKTQDPSSLARRFEGFTVPALPNARNNRNGRCYVLCGRSGVTLTALLHIVLVVSSCLSLQGVARRYRRPLSPSGSGRQYHVPTSSRVRNSLFCLSSSGDSWYCSVPSFQEELRCRPGVEGGYVAQAYHLYAPLLQGHCPSVPQLLPPGPCGGGTGLGLTLACSPGHSTPK